MRGTGDTLAIFILTALVVTSLFGIGFNRIQSEDSSDDIASCTYAFSCL